MLLALALACLPVPKLAPPAAPTSLAPVCGDAPARAATTEERDHAYAVFAAGLKQSPPPTGARCALSCESAPCYAGCEYEGSFVAWTPRTSTPEFSGYWIEGHGFGSSGKRDQTLAYTATGAWGDDRICQKQRGEELRATIEGSPLPTPRTRATRCPEPADWPASALARTAEATAEFTVLQASCPQLGHCVSTCTEWPCTTRCAETAQQGDELRACLQEHAPGDWGYSSQSGNETVRTHIVRRPGDPEVPYDCLR